MISDEKVRELKRKLKRGEPEGEIRELMQQEGYTKVDIDIVFAPHKYDMRSWYLSFAIIIFIAGVIVFLRTKGLLLIILSGLLLFAYLNEIKRLQKQGD
jgi:hypothetical protein